MGADFGPHSLLGISKLLAAGWTGRDAEAGEIHNGFRDVVGDIEAAFWEGPGTYTVKLCRQ